MKLGSQQYRAWSACMDVKASLALYWWQRLITFGSSFRLQLLFKATDLRGESEKGPSASLLTYTQTFFALTPQDDIIQETMPEPFYDLNSYKNKNLASNIFFCKKENVTQGDGI